MNNFKQKLLSFLRGRNFASGLLVAIIVASVVFVNIIAYTLTESFGLYIYSPEQPDFAISDTFSEAFGAAAKRGEEVTVTFCMDEDDVKAHSTGSYVRETANRFKEKYGELVTLRYVNLITMYDQDGRDVSDELNGYKAICEKEKEDYLAGKASTYSAISKTSVIFRSGENYKILTDVSSGVGYVDFYTLDSRGYVTSYNGEEIFASMINWVLTDEHPTAYFTTGHGESFSKNLHTALLCAGYEVDVLNLRNPKLDRAEVVKMLDGAGLIVISNPTSDFEKAAPGSGIQTEIELLEYYAKGGGSFLITTDPYFPRKNLKSLYGFIESYGITMFDDAEGNAQTVRDTDNGIPGDGFTVYAELGESDVAQQIARKLSDSGRVILRDVSPLRLTGNAKALLETSASSVCFADGEITDREGNYPIAALSEKTGDTGNTSRMFFIPSVYLTASDAMVSTGYANKDFMYSLFDVYFGLGDMPYGANSIVFNNQVLEGLTMGMANIYSAILIAIPAVVGLVGAVTLIRRKNR